MLRLLTKSLWTEVHQKLFKPLVCSLPSAIRHFSQSHSTSEDVKSNIRGVTLDSIGTWNHRLDLPVNISESIKTGNLIPQLDVNSSGSASVNGRRSQNEDVYLTTQLTPDIIMLSIYDGHGGLMAAEFARDHMSEALLENIKKYDNNLEDALRHSFIKVNNLFTKYLQNNYRGQEAAQRTGTTATVCLIRNSSELFVAHVGDSHALICRDGKAMRLTQDHSPEDKSEINRIKDCGGKITWSSLGRPRVNGVLNMTRSIGDISLQKFGVVSTPDVKKLKLKPARDAFLVLVTDGVSYVLNSQEIVDQSLTCKSAREAANRITDQALHFGTEDNATAVVMPLGSWGKVFPGSRINFRLVGSRHC